MKTLSQHAFSFQPAFQGHRWAGMLCLQGVYSIEDTAKNPIREVSGT
jgi:hypothetical protein